MSLFIGAIGTIGTNGKSSSRFVTISKLHLIGGT